ncbi:hypothetical protein GEMRC1_001566 [Eukaryota sp. GEM-RC1]
MHYFLLLLLVAVTLAHVTLKGQVHNVHSHSSANIYVNAKLHSKVSTSGRFLLVLNENDRFLVECSHPDFIFGIKTIITSSNQTFVPGVVSNKPLTRLVFSPLESAVVPEIDTKQLIITFLKRPLVIAIGVFLFSVIGLRLCTVGMSPEEREQLQANTGHIDPQNPLSLLKLFNTQPASETSTR